MLTIFRSRRVRPDLPPAPPAPFPALNPGPGPVLLQPAPLLPFSGMKKRNLWQSMQHAAKTWPLTHHLATHASIATVATVIGIVLEPTLHSALASSMYPGGVPPTAVDGIASLSKAVISVAAIATAAAVSVPTYYFVTPLLNWKNDKPHRQQTDYLNHMQNSLAPAVKLAHATMINEIKFTRPRLRRAPLSTQMADQKLKLYYLHDVFTQNITNGELNGTIHSASMPAEGEQAARFTHALVLHDDAVKRGQKGTGKIFPLSETEADYLKSVAAEKNITLQPPLDDKEAHQKLTDTLNANAQTKHYSVINTIPSGFATDDNKKSASILWIKAQIAYDRKKHLPEESEEHKIDIPSRSR